jgi:hypothetical protein
MGYKMVYTFTTAVQPFMVNIELTGDSNYLIFFLTLRQFVWAIQVNHQIVHLLHRCCAMSR